MTAEIRAHIEKHGWKWTSAGIVGAVGTFGVVLLSLNATVTKLEDQQKKDNIAPVDPVATVSYVDALVDERCPLKKHRKAAAQRVPQPPPPHEGLFPRLWHVLF